MAVKAPSAAWAWLFWLLMGAGWVLMLSGVSALQQVCPELLTARHRSAFGPSASPAAGAAACKQVSCLP
jgi:hypothetical protein